MNRVLQVLLFLMVNAAGWFMASMIFTFAAVIHFFPGLPDGALKQQLAFCVFSVSPWISVAMVLVSIGYFFARGEARTWLILAPLYVPALYSILVLVYFNFVGVG